MQVGEARLGRREPTSTQESDDARNSMSTAAPEAANKTADATSGDQKGGEVRLPKLDPNKRTQPQESSPQGNAWVWPKGAKKGEGKKGKKGAEKGRKEREERGKGNPKTVTTRKAHPMNRPVLVPPKDQVT